MDRDKRMTTQPVVTTTMFTPAEQAAWTVAVERGLSIEAADVRQMLEAATPLIRADERERITSLLEQLVINWKWYTDRRTVRDAIDLIRKETTDGP